MPSWTWYKERLSVMPPQEIPYRIYQQLRNVTGRFRRWPKAADMSLKSVCAATPDLARFKEEARPFPCNSNAPDVFTEHDKLLEDAERLLAHRFSFHAFENEELGTPLNWNREYSQGVDIPLDFAPAIDFHNSERVGDVKYAWSLGGTMRHLPRLAQAYRATGDERFAWEVVEQLTSWIEQCPYMKGIQWASPTISAKRLIAWVPAVEWIKHSSAFTEEFLTLMFRSVHQHLDYVTKNHSRYSSANNHLIAELTGVYLAASYWKELKGAPAWKNRARKMLVEQCLRQNAPDGVNREQAMGYQYFIWDLLVLPALSAESEGEPFPEEYLQRLEKMAEFMAWTADCRQHVPNIGDEDCEIALWIGDKDVPNPVSLLNTASLMWNKPEYKCWAGGRLDEKTAWRLPDRLTRRYEELSCGESLSPIRPNRLFPEGGYLVWREGSTPDDEAMLVFDHGPMGFGGTAAHGHSDALSICLHLGGEPILIDPGTFSYQDTEHRKRLRSAAVHNTLSFGEENHSKYINRFIWGQKHRAELDSLQDNGLTAFAHAFVKWWTGDHHRRELKWHPKAGKLLVLDKWESEVCPDIHFTVSPECSVSLDGEICRIEGQRAVLRIENRECDVMLEPMEISPTCYRLTDGFRLVLKPKDNVRATLTTLKWEFRG